MSDPQEMYTRPLYFSNSSMQVCGVICTGIDPFSFIRKAETIDDDNLLSPEFVMNLEEFAFYFNEYFPRMLFVHEEGYREYFEMFVGTFLEGTDDPYQFFFCKIPESEEKVEALLSGGTSIEGEFTWQAHVLSDRGLHILWQETPQILNILLYVGAALFLVSLSVIVWVFVKFFLAEGAGAGPPQRGIGRRFLSLVMWVFVILLAMTFIVAGVFVLAANAAYADRTLPEIREFLFDYRLAGLLTGGAFTASLLGVGLAWPIAVRKKRASEDRT